MGNDLIKPSLDFTDPVNYFPFLSLRSCLHSPFSSICSLNTFNQGFGPAAPSNLLWLLQNGDINAHSSVLDLPASLDRDVHSTS